MTHICVDNLNTIGSDNGLSPGRRQAIICTNAGILLIGPLLTNFSEILFEIPTLSFKKMRLKVSSAKRRPFCIGLNVLKRPLRVQAQYGLTCKCVCPHINTLCSLCHIEVICKHFFPTRDLVNQSHVKAYRRRCNINVLYQHKTEHSELNVEYWRTFLYFLPRSFPKAPGRSKPPYKFW